MFRESSSYYLLGYQPTNLRLDGRFRRIRVQVHRPGVRILSRAGYYAPTGRPAAKTSAPSAADRALSGGLPAGDLPVALTVAPFATRAGAGGALAVVAGVDGTSLAPGAQVDLVATAFDDTWKQVARVTEQFVMPHDLDAASSLDLGTGLNLRPGRYEIRVALTSSTPALTGSVYTSVTVPDFARAPLSMSGILIERAPGGAVMPEALAVLLAARPTTARVFSPADAVSAVARVRQGGRRPLLPIDLTVRIVDHQDRLAFERTTMLDAPGFDAGREADYHLALPLDQLADGPHLLTIEAAAGQSRVRRDVRFTVRRD